MNARRIRLAVTFQHDSTEAAMEPEGHDMGDYQERYLDCDIEVAVE